MRTFVIGDSFMEGTAAWSPMQGLGGVMCGVLGWDFWNSSQGGTGYVNAGAVTAYRTTAYDRIAPPACSWKLNISANTSGNFTLTFGAQTTASLAFNVSPNVAVATLGTPSAGTFTLSVANVSGTVTTAGIAFNASASTVQTALNALTLGGTAVASSVSGSNGGPYSVYFTDQTQVLSGSGAGLTGGTFSVSTTILSALAALSNVGAGNVRVIGPYQGRSFITFLNGLASSVNTLTITNSTLATSGGPGPTQYCTQWTGDLAAYVPKDGSGNVLPFNVVFATGLNDNTFNTTTVANAAATAWGWVQQNFPQANVFVLGPFSGSGTPNSAIVAVDAALSAKAATTLNKINGKTPYFSLCQSTTLNLLRTGTGNLGSPNGSGDADYRTTTDSTHPTFQGHAADGRSLAGLLYDLLNN